MNRDNLMKLADYLLALPATYNHFDMGMFHGSAYFPRQVDPESACGTIACAVGHGPYAGIPDVKGESWRDYSFRAFFGIRPLTYEEQLGQDAPSVPDDVAAKWVWCFSADWENIDNTPRGAARRIRWMLASPDNEAWIVEKDKQARAHGCNIEDWLRWELQAKEYPEVIAKYQDA